MMYYSSHQSSIETTLQCTEMKYIQSAQMQSRMRQFQASLILLVLVLKTMNCTFLSFRVPAKPGIAKDLIEADDIGRKAVADCIDSF